MRAKGVSAMSKTVLVVDDSAAIRKALEISLKREGYQVREASDGMEALEALKGDPVHLVICDVNMPRMDGLTFVKTLRSDPDRKFLPVMMLTTENQKEKMEEGKAMGVRAWLVKPFEASALLSAVSRLLV